MSENVRVRYGRVSSQPKNTLVTVRDGNNIYFGIARCNNSAGDHFMKYRGRMIASRRAALAASEAESYGNLPGIENIQVHESGLRGRVEKEHVVELLRFFDNIDRILWNNALTQNTETAVSHVGV